MSQIVNFTFLYSTSSRLKPEKKIQLFSEKGVVTLTYAKSELWRSFLIEQGRVQSDREVIEDSPIVG